MLLLALLPLFFLTPLVGTAGAQKEVDTPTLFGITSVLVNKNAIEVVKDETLLAGLDLWAGGKRVAKATVVVGDTFEVTDKQHLGYSFKLVEVGQGLATLETTYWTAFLGRKPTHSTSIRVVGSYVTRRKERR